MEQMTDATTVTGERALARMRRYTTISLTFALGAFVLLIVVSAPTVPLQLITAGVGAIVIALTVFWEHPAPVWLQAVGVIAAGALWCYHLSTGQSPIVVLLYTMAIAVQVSHARVRRWWWIAAGFAFVLGPLVAAVVAAPATNWVPWFSVAVVSYVASLGLFLLNRYAWGLYLEIDSLRRNSAELAVAQERYRFAADLHDIQGHTLHVIRLKTRLAAKLLERDPAAAREQLDEADELIGETLANTRSLAFGVRHVALASELANAGELLEAAGITWTVSGAQGTEHHDDLFGLVMRETTTNVLRHAQATRVSVELEPHRLVIRNDGSPPTTRPLSGLARLAERFDAVGGTLRTSVADGTFTTEASIP